MMEKKEEHGQDEDLDDEDLDDALEAMFDEPSTPPPAEQSKQPEELPASRITPPSTPQETCIPQTPEPSPKKPRRKGVLEHLLENSNRLSAGAARVAQDLQKLTEANKKEYDKAGAPPSISDPSNQNIENNASIAEVMLLRRGKGKTQPSKRAFTVIGKDERPLGSAHATKKYDYIDANVTNMSLIEAPFEKARLEAVFEHSYRVDIADVRSRYEEIYTGALKDYTIFGCLVKKLSKKQSKKGKMFAIWSLCNMPRTKRRDREVTTTVVRLYLFDEAYEAFHTRCEGTVFALRKPGVWAGYSDGNENRSQSSVMPSLRISKKDSIAVLGVCKDFKLCESRRANGEICGQWYHSNQLTNCPSHEMTRKRGIHSGTRMDIQNAVRPSLKDPIKAIRVPMDISSSTREKEVVEQDESGFRKARDAQRAREIRKRGSAKRLQTLKITNRILPPAVQGGLTKRSAGKDFASKRIKEARGGRNRLGERHGRLQDRNERQCSYHGACATLHRLGFKLRADGGWDPPKKLDVPLVTSKTHKFNGLGRVMLSFGGDPIYGKNGLEVVHDGEGDGSRQDGNGKEVFAETEEDDHMEMDADCERENDGITGAQDEQESAEEVQTREQATESGKENANGASMDEIKILSNAVQAPTDQQLQQQICKEEGDIVLSDESDEE